jgi:hypothetical protein
MLSNEVAQAVGEPPRVHEFRRGPRVANWEYANFTAILIGERLVSLVEPETVKW